jgi:hypothetical protein
MSEVKTTDQGKLVEDLRRNGQSFTADRVEALSKIAFEIFKRDLLARYAADGRFGA